MKSTYVDLRPADRPHSVEVQLELGGAWIPGTLLAYRRDHEGRWSAWVEYSDGQGNEHHMDWFAEHRVRRVA